MNILRRYLKELNKKGVDLKLLPSSEKNEWKCQLSCIQPISEIKELEDLFKGLYQFVGDLILDGYEVEIVDNFNFLIRKPD